MHRGGPADSRDAGERALTAGRIRTPFVCMKIQYKLIRRLRAPQLRCHTRPSQTPPDIINCRSETRVSRPSDHHKQESCPTCYGHDQHGSRAPSLPLSLTIYIYIFRVPAGIRAAPPPPPPPPTSPYLRLCVSPARPVIHLYLVAPRSAAIRLYDQTPEVEQNVLAEVCLENSDNSVELFQKSCQQLYLSFRTMSAAVGFPDDGRGSTGISKRRQTVPGTTRVPVFTCLGTRVCC